MVPGCFIFFNAGIWSGNKEYEKIFKITDSFSQLGSSLHTWEKINKPFTALQPFNSDTIKSINKTIELTKIPSLIPPQLRKPKDE